MLLGLGRFQISAEISMRLYQRVYEISGWLVADPMFLPLLLPSSSLLHLYSSLLPLTFFSSRSHPSFLPLFPLPSHVPYSYFSPPHLLPATDGGMQEGEATGEAVGGTALPPQEKKRGGRTKKKKKKTRSVVKLAEVLVTSCT